MIKFIYSFWGEVEINFIKKLIPEYKIFLDIIKIF